jgi:multidrug transporter EmrE-like cation transporter
MLAWLFILLSSGCSVLIAHLFKLIEFRKLNTMRVLTVNYLIAMCVAFFTSGNPAAEVNFAILAPVLGIAAVVGVIFIANYFIYSKSVHLNGVGISVASMRISLIVPVLLSTYWYHEYLLAREWVGVSLVFVTLLLLLPDKQNLFKRPYNSAWLLILIFLFTGLGDSSLKIYEADFSGILSKELFMGYVFLAAFIAGILILMIKGNWAFSRDELIFGILIGVPNLYSALFLIEALSLLSGGIVYTAANLFTVIGATILGIWRWGDILTKAQWFGLGLTLISILLLI